MCLPNDSANEVEESDRGKNYSQRSQAYLEAVTRYAQLKDKACGAPMSDLMRMTLFINMQEKIPSEILSICDKLQAAIDRGEKDLKSFIRELEKSELGVGKV